MRHISLALAALALPLSACTLPQPLPTPSTVAETTKLDEQAGITAELGYKLFRVAVETGVKAGAIKGARATQIADIDNRLFAGLEAIRAAYATGNAATYDSAIRNFNVVLASGNAALGGN